MEGKRESDFMSSIATKWMNAKNCSRAIRVARGSGQWATQRYGPVYFSYPTSLAVFALPRFGREVDYILWVQVFTINP